MTPQFRHILDALSGTQAYNLHSHTEWCDGRATMAEMAEAALASGMEHYGFSPHSPLPLPSPCNMARESVDAYLAEARRLKGVCEGRCRIYASMEIDFLGAQWGPSNDYFQSLPLDYRIGSIHFIPNLKGEYYDIDGSPERFDRYLGEAFDGDLRYVVETYFRQSMAMVAAGGFDIIGHLDKIGYNASCVSPGLDREPWFVAHVSDLIDAVAAAGVAVEINTKARESCGRFFPHESFWPRIKELGVPVVVNSDAHYPALVNAGRDEAFALLAREA